MRKQLMAAALLVLALEVAHTVDHLIGHPADAIGQIPGYVGFLTIGGTLFLIWRDDRFAPLAAAATGFAAAAGLIAIHLIPEHWGVLSDPYSSLDLSFVSWAIVFANIAAGLWLGAIGLREMRTPRHATA